MARYFNGKKVELLAPAGTYETFLALCDARCDAIYVGGKSLNMRMMRTGFNLSDEQLREGSILAHSKGKSVYVTLNNLLNDYEMNEAVEYIQYLDSTEIDGIIVQDLSVLDIVRSANIKNLEVHTSVMMNVHNIETVKALQEYGVSRVVVSREMDLKTVKNMHDVTGIEIEYFMHGDMCVAHGANCYYSSILFGNSGNRGRCFKPCRWAYRVKKDGKLYPTEYPLAVKDMYMYEHIPELIENNVTSFKIEGRMRDTEFVVRLINWYGEAIDRYIEDPLSFDRYKDSDNLHENRKRDLSTGYAFKKPGLEYINTRYEGTGKFYSTGKMFSTPTEEKELRPEIVDNLRKELNLENATAGTDKKKLSVKVNNFEQGKAAAELGVDRIYLQTEVLLPDRFLSVSEINALKEVNKNTEIFLSLPQMMDELWFDRIDHYLENHGHLFDGLVVSNLGAIKKYGSKFHLIGDYNLNILNQKSMGVYRENGLKEVTLSIEARKNEVIEFLNNAKDPVEIVVHGPLKVMYLEHNLYENTDHFEPIAEADNKYVDNSVLVLLTDKGENPVYIDQESRNHMYTAKEYNLMPFLDKFDVVAPIHYRIEGQTYSVDELKQVIKHYQSVMNGDRTNLEEFQTMKSVRAGYTIGSLIYEYTENK